MRRISRSHAVRLACSIVIASLSSAVAPARGGSAPPAPGAEERAKTASILVDQGWNALAAGQYDAAVEALTDARHALQIDHSPADLDTDPHYVVALQGLAVAYIRQRDFVRAGQLFKRGETLDKVCATNPPPGLLVNRAIVDLVQRLNVLRSAKALAAAMEADPAPVPDETTLNLLGTALAQAERNQPISRGTIEQLESSYERLNERLEVTRPGEKRWGTRWVNAGEFNALDQKRRLALATFRQARAAASAAAYRVAAARWDADRAQMYDFAWGQSIVFHTAYQEPADVAYSRTQLQLAQERLDAAISAANAAQAAMPAVEWLADAEPVLPPRPLAGGDPTFAPDAFASADPNVSGPPAWEPSPAAAAVVSRDRCHVVFTAPPPEPAAVAMANKRAAGPFARYACAFPVDRFRLVTASAPLNGCDHVQIQDADGHTLRANVVARDGALAMLEIDPASRGGRPLDYLTTADRFVAGPVRCAALAEPNVFRARPAMLGGQAGADKDGVFAARLEEHPRLPGAPLLTSSGRLVGVELSRRDDGRANLPAVNLATLRDFLVAHHAVPEQPSETPVDQSSVFQVIATMGGDS